VHKIHEGGRESQEFRSIVLVDEWYAVNGWRLEVGIQCSGSSDSTVIQVVGEGGKGTV
jgi:hypothetical protein